MTGQRIYYVPPRRLGSLESWSGKDAPGGQSWLLEHAESMNFNAIWFSPFMTTTKVEKVHKGKTLTGSLYAIRDHVMLDPEFSSSGLSCHDDLGEAQRRSVILQDAAHLRHFCAQAAAKNMRVYGDLVFNHVAADHPLVLSEQRAIDDILACSGGAYDIVRGDHGDITGLSYRQGAEEKIFLFKFKRNDDLKLQIGGTPEDPWSDVAQICFSSPAARKFFIDGEDGEQGYFKKVIDWHLDRGFTAFRCDVAYKIPPDVWTSLISYAHQRLEGVIFLAETLGAEEASFKALAKADMTDKAGRERPAFDHGMEGFYWWDYKQDWLPLNEHRLVLGMSKFGGAAAPDLHDTEATLAAAFTKASLTSEANARACFRDYAISALGASAVFMQMGFEYGNENQNTVFKGAVSDRERKNFGKDPPFDLTRAIAGINAFKESLGIDNCIVEFPDYVDKSVRTATADHGATATPGLLRLHCRYIDVDHKILLGECVLLINKNPENGPLRLPQDCLDALEKSGFMREGNRSEVADIAIFRAPPPPHMPSAVKPAARFGF